METNEKQYQTGFNNGYLLSKHNPELLNKLTAGLKSDNDYINGLFAGKDEHEMEVGKNKKQEPAKSKLKDHAKSKGQEFQKTSIASKKIDRDIG
ncbi:hypothetical protein BH10BAC2_BH10BAC2_27090 [soil metagenome]